MTSTYQRRTVPEPDRRGTVQRLNDQTMEFVILLMRVGALILGVFAVISIFAWIWSGGWRWGVTLAVQLAVGGVAGWLGFWVFGNEEWRSADPR